MSCKKYFKPFTTVDFKDGFKAQLAKYNYPILKRISDELWYELLNIEEKYCGNCKKLLSCNKFEKLKIIAVS